MLLLLLSILLSPPGAAALHGGVTGELPPHPPGPEGSSTAFLARAPLPEPLQEVQAAAYGR